MTIHHLLRILLVRKWWIVGAIGVAVALAAIFLLVTPKRYTATASIVVNSRGSDPLALGTSQGQGGTLSLPTQADIVKRPRVARRVVADLGLDRDSATRAAWEAAGEPGEFADWVAQGAAAGITTVVGSETNVLDIQYTSKNPQVATKFANAFASAYLETTLELRTDPARQYVSFFDDRLTELRNGVARSQAKLSNFLKSAGLTDGGGRMDVENARLAELSSQLAAAQGQLADSSSRERGTLQDATASPEIMQNPLVQSLKGQLAQQQIKVQEMSQRLGPNHPLYLQAQAELKEIRARLAGEVGQVSASTGAAQRVSRDRLASIQAAFDTQRQRVLSLQEQHDQADVLAKEVDNAQRAYELVMQRQTQTTIESQAQQTDASLLDRASIPARPSFPNVKLTVLLALVAGTLIGTMLALGREFFSPLIRSSEDLLTYTGLPVLAVVPSARLARVPRLALPGTRHDPRLLPS